MKCLLSTKLFLVTGECLTVLGQKNEKKIQPVAKSWLYSGDQKKLEVPLMYNLKA